MLLLVLSTLLKLARKRVKINEFSFFYHPEASSHFLFAWTTNVQLDLPILSIFFCSCKMGVPGKTEGTIFSPVPCEIMLTGPERVGGERERQNDDQVLYLKEHTLLYML